MTNLNFKQLDRLFRNDDFPSIEEDVRGSRFLKLRSMSRKDTMERFCEIFSGNQGELQTILNLVDENDGY
jgi:hypothetical protein